MFFKKAAAIVALLAIPTFAVQAQDSNGNAAKGNNGASQSSTKTPGSGPNPFTDCGIGAALFPNTGWAAVTSNVIWDIGITALTSATASPETCSGKRLAVAAFINDTYEKLAEETARGQGEHLTTALNIMECDGASHASAIASVRGAMADLVADPAYASQPRLEKASQYYQAVESAVSKSCSA